jgi:sporulation protein YlmC with PRC-barrel domain
MMNKRFSKITLATITLAGSFCVAQPAFSQVAGGTTTVGISVIESTQIAAGWSAKKTLMGKAIYNDAGQKVGKVEDLIISPDKKLSYVIVGAGGFLGMGRNDVAVPVTQIEDKAGKLVMAGATKDTVKAMPPFTYATDNSKRDAFVAAADKDIAKGKAKVADLEKKAAASAADAKTKINTEIATLKADVTAAEAKLGDMKRATSARWKEFEADVSAATAKLRKSTDTPTG